MKGISSMATRAVLNDLAEAAVASGLPRVEVESVGGVDAANRVAAEPLDLVFLSADALAKLAASGHVDPATVTPLVLSQVAVAVPAPGAGPAGRPEGFAFPDAAGVRSALLGATRVGYSTGPSGTALVRMIGDWGLSDELEGRLVQARAGVPVTALLTSGEADLGFQQLSEMVGQEGVRVLGVLPPDCAIDTIFSGAVATAASDPAAAAEVLGWLASEAASDIKTQHAFISH